MARTALAVVGVTLGLALGCGTAQEAVKPPVRVVTVPKVEIVRVPCVTAELPPLALPAYPPAPTELGDAAGWAAWFRSMAAIAAQREQLQAERIKAQRTIIAGCAHVGE